MNKNKKYNCIVTPSYGEPRAITVTYEKTCGNCHKFSGEGCLALSTSLEGHSINYLVDLSPGNLLPMPSGRMTPSCVLLQTVRFDDILRQLKDIVQAKYWLALSYTEQSQWLRDRGVRPAMRPEYASEPYLGLLQKACMQLLVKPVVDSRGTELSIGDEVVVLKNDSCCFEVGQVGNYTKPYGDGEGCLWVKSCGTSQVLRPEQVLKIV